MKNQDLKDRIKELEEEVVRLRIYIMELKAQKFPSMLNPYFPYSPCPPPHIMVSNGTGTKDDLFCGEIE
jgi:hypothetical protein